MVADNTSLHSSSVNQAHRVDLHLWRGAPQNLDDERPVEVLVNDGFVVGFCPSRLQPLWSAYRVAGSKNDLGFDRPLSYYDDLRLSDEQRIGKGTFGKIGGVQLHVGHMTPNSVINRQFGRLAQLETFLMSNMSPQYGSLNTGVWLKLENAISDIEDEPGKQHVWAIVGPVFGNAPAMIDRGGGKHLPIPDAYFCVIVEPHSYPYDTPSKAHIDCFIVPQQAPGITFPQDYPATLEDVEQATGLKFFASWGRNLNGGIASESEDAPVAPSRLRESLNAHRADAEREATKAVSKAKEDIHTIDGLIDALKADAAAIQLQGRALTIEEINRLQTIQHTISWLLRAKEIADPSVEPDQPVAPAPMITYNVVSDLDELLKTGARTACNFWNRFVQPEQSIVIRLGVFTQNSNTIARAYKPYSNETARYGRVEFNTKYLATFTANEIAGTIIHEIGHTLGIGWDQWEALFSRTTGRFTAEAITLVNDLQFMEVEREGGPGTKLAHWDEALFDKELMTGFQDHGEFVLPVTIDVMKAFGHTVIERLETGTPLADLLTDAAGVVFSRQGDIEHLDLDHFEDTEEFETIPHPTGSGFGVTATGGGDRSLRGARP